MTPLGGRSGGRCGCSPTCEGWTPRPEERTIRCLGEPTDLDLSADPLSHDERLERGQVTLQVSVASEGELRVYHQSPTQPFYIGADAKTCDVVIAKSVLNVDRLCLFEIRSDLVFLSKVAEARGATVTVGRRHLPLRIQLGRSIFDLGWSEDPTLLAQWAAPETTNVNKRYGPTVRCAVTLPARIHCRHCGADLEGNVLAHGSGRDPKRALATVEARRKAIDRASEVAALASCPSCGRHATGAITKVVRNSALALGVMLGAVACLALLPEIRRAFPLLLIPCASAFTVLYANFDLRRAGARIRLTPARRSA